MSKSVLANKIGYSLFEVAKENNSLEEVSYELNEVAKVVNESSDFVTLMNNPNIEKIKKNIVFYKKLQISSKIKAFFNHFTDSFLVKLLKSLRNRPSINFLVT